MHQLEDCEPFSLLHNFASLRNFRDVRRKSEVKETFGGQHLKPLFLRGCSNQCFNPFVEVLCKFGNVFDCGEMPKCNLSVEKATEQYCDVYYPVQGGSNFCLWMKPLRVSIRMKPTEPHFFFVLLFYCAVRDSPKAF